MSGKYEISQGEERGIVFLVKFNEKSTMELYI